MKKTGKEVKTPGVDVRQTSIRLQFTGPDGTRHRLTIKDAGGSPLPPTVANVRAAERTMADIRAAIRIGAFNVADYFPDLGSDAATAQSAPITVGDQLETWLSGLTVATSTRKGYESAIRFWRSAPCGPASEDGIVPLLVDVPLVDVVFSQVRHALAAGTSRTRRGKPTEPKPLKPKTSNNYLAVLRSALDLAIDDGLITKTPAGEGKKLRAKVQKEDPDPLSMDELDLVLEHISKKAQAAGDYAEFWAMTGLRTSEINGLRWGSVDLRNGSVFIHEVVVVGEHKDTTKTNMARTVRLNSRARACIERQRARTQLQGGIVWVNPFDGLPWDGYRDFLRSYWQPALRAHGIRYRRPYNLRHTCATMLLMAGVPPALAAKQMGHTLQTFFKDYAKWIESANDVKELSKVDAMLQSRSRGTASSGT